MTTSERDTVRSARRPKGDSQINRWAQAGYTSVLFCGQRYALSKEHLYGTRLDKKTGKRTIVIIMR